MEFFFSMGFTMVFGRYFHGYLGSSHKLGPFLDPQNSTAP